MTVTHLLFDCDNTLVLSEEIAFAECTALINEILTKYKVDKQFTPEQLLSDFVGQNFRGILVTLKGQYNFDISESEIDGYVVTEMERVIAKLEQEAIPCVGSMEVLEKLYKDKKYGLAVVSSSALRRVQASIKRTNQAPFFPFDHVFSAATSLPYPSCKPDPAIYLHACKVIGKKPEECVAVEDSKSGTLSAVRAGIPTLGYVGSYPESKQAEMTKNLLAAGCKLVMSHWSEFEKSLEQF